MFPFPNFFINLEQCEAMWREYLWPKEEEQKGSLKGRITSPEAEMLNISPSPTLPCPAMLVGASSVTSSVPCRIQPAPVLARWSAFQLPDYACSLLAHCHLSYHQGSYPLGLPTAKLHMQPASPMTASPKPPRIESAKPVSRARQHGMLLSSSDEPSMLSQAPSYSKITTS